MPKCEVCGEPMPEGEEMFKYHGYSGPCPKPPLKREPVAEETGWVIERADSDASRPLYFAGKNWEYDNLKAIRFARREDAQAMSSYMFPGEPHRIADHMWC